MDELRKAAEDLLEGVEVAIKAGDWKVDGACDPDSAIHALRQALVQDNKFSETDPCETENEEDMCSLCNCWKKTREMCS